MRLIFPFILVFSFSSVVLVTSLSDAPFYSRGESREALVVQAMSEQSNYLLPLRGGYDIPSKPPMFHWLATVSTKIFSSKIEWGIRLPSAVSGALGVSILGLFAYYFRGYRIFLLSSLLLISTFSWLRYSSVARVDMVFTFFLTLTLFLLYALVSQKKQHYWTLVVGSAIFAAGTTLAKGPLGLLLVYAIAFAFVCFQALVRKKISLGPFLSLAESFLIALVISGSWYLWAYLVYGDAFLYRQIIFENVGRLVGGSDFAVGHEKPLYYIPIFLFTALLPWSFFLPLVAVWLWDKKKELGKKDDVAFSIIWFLMVIAALSISASKRSVYLLPATPAIAYLIALCLTDKEWIESERMLKYKNYLGVFFLGGSIIGLVLALFFVLTRFLSASLLLKLASLISNSKSDLVLLIITSTGNSLLAIALIILCAIFCWYYYKVSSKEIKTSSIFLLGVASIAINYYVQQHFLPKEEQRIAAASFANELNKIVAPKYPIYQLDSNYYAVTFYLGRDVARIKEASSKLLDGSGYLLLSESKLAQIKLLLPESKELARSASRVDNDLRRLALVAFGQAAKEHYSTAEETVKEAFEQTESHQQSPSEQVPDALLAPDPDSEMGLQEPASTEPR